MTIVLNHTIVPAHDKEESASFFARIFGLGYESVAGHFAPVRVNAELTLDFDNATNFESHHYAFLISESELDEILCRVVGEGIVYGSDPWSRENGQLNSRNGGRGFYFPDPAGHLLEVMTRE
jgi:catechol 2,3-dioxygenase-like lactoylglutathione lyase family enzyme